MNQLEKTAILELLATGAAAHVAQNIAAKRTLLNKKGGVTLASRFIKGQTNKRNSFTRGLSNAIVPEKAMLADELQPVVGSIKTMTRPERAVAQQIGQGNISRAVNSKIFRDSPALNSMLGNALPGMNVSRVQNYLKAFPKRAQAFDNNFKQSKLGQVSSGLTDALSKQKLDNITVGNMNKMEALGEGVGNFALQVEPGALAVNSFKRVIGSKNDAPQSVYGKIKGYVKEPIEKKIVLNPVENAFNNGLQGQANNRIKMGTKSLIMNPVAAAAEDLANSSGLILAGHNK